MQADGYIQTVTGRIAPADLGTTYCHEHLIMNPGPLHPESILLDLDKAVREVGDFCRAGGRTLVEMSPLNFGRNAAAYRDIALLCDINVICATGFHKASFLPEWVYDADDREIMAVLLAEIRQGIDGTGIKPGVIKCGSSLEEITDVERKIVGIAAAVHKETGLPISTHCERGRMGLEQCRLFLELGAKPEQVIIGHADIPLDTRYLKEICSLGFNICIDHVGREAKDETRIGMIQELIASGFIKQIVLSGDMGKRGYLRSYGGKPGLGYILNELSGHMRARGISGEEIGQLLVKNPRRIFTIRNEG